MGELKGRVIAGVLVTSLALNLLLLTQIVPLLSYYSAYWTMRNWVSENVLRRSRPDTAVIYQSSEFMLRPAQRSGARFGLQEILQGDDPVRIQRELRLATAEAFGMGRVPSGPLDLAVHSSEQLDSHVRYKVSYQTQRGVKIPAYLLEPSEVPPPWPAVLVLHGCGYGKAGVVGLVSDPHNNVGVHLVEAGFLVLAPDRRGFGELQPTREYISPSCGSGPGDGRRLLEADAQAAFGTDLRALDVIDALIALRYLADRPDTDTVGVAGLSGGGVVAEYVAGLSEHAAAVVLSNSLGLPPGYGDSDQPDVAAEPSARFPPTPGTPLGRLKERCIVCGVMGIERLADDLPTVLLALLPPRPVLIQYGEEDEVNYKRSGPEAIEAVRSLYGLFGVADRVNVNIESGGHEMFADPITAFFEESLRR